MIIVIGSFRMSPDKLAAARPVLVDLIARSRAEDGCNSYALSEDLCEPGLIRIAESWRDKAALAAHAKSPHFEQWRAMGDDFGVHDRDLGIHKIADA